MTLKKWKRLSKPKRMKMKLLTIDLTKAFKNKNHKSSHFIIWYPRISCEVFRKVWHAQFARRWWLTLSSTSSAFTDSAQTVLKHITVRVKKNARSVELSFRTEDSLELIRTLLLCCSTWVKSLERFNAKRSWKIMKLKGNFFLSKKSSKKDEKGRRQRIQVLQPKNSLRKLKMNG